jgi:predicted Zn-dependent protease
MTDEEEPGSDKVTACTRAFEEIDAQVFPGPGRGATRLEATASDRWRGPSPATVAAYRRMFALVVKHELAHSDPMSQHDRRPPTTSLARIGRATTLVTPSTKPRSSKGADVPNVSRRLQSRLPPKANT